MKANYKEKFNKDKQLEEKVKEELQKAYSNGLSVGAKAIAKVILEKALNETKSEHDRLIDIAEFCKTGLTGNRSELK